MATKKEILKDSYSKLLKEEKTLWKEHFVELPTEHGTPQQIKIESYVGKPWYKKFFNFLING